MAASCALVLDAIRDEAIAIQDDERYGHFSNPVMLGLLLAAEIVRNIDNEGDN